MNGFRLQSGPRETISLFLLLTAVLALSACGGGSSGGATGPPPPPPEMTVTLGFDPPATYTDGFPITDFAGYVLYYGQAPGSYVQSIDVGNVPTYTIALPSGTWYFAAKAYTLAGTVSGFSDEIPVTL